MFSIQGTFLQILPFLALAYAIPRRLVELPSQNISPVTDPLGNPVYPANEYGTNLYGWDKCNEKDPTWISQIKDAYKDANKLVNYKGVKSDLDFNSAAALEFLGPSGLNVDQQKQIQAVLANVATVKTAFWFTPNWIRARCDDPESRCPQENPPCDPPTSQDDGPRNVLGAYARNPEKTEHGYSDISFCPAFFKLRNLENAMAFGSGPSTPRLRFDLSRYEGRADTFLHELLHLDLAANSVNENPNPHVRDLKIKFIYGENQPDIVEPGKPPIPGPRQGDKSKWIKVYGPKLAKILARFQPISSVSKQTGYFIQRSDDSYTMFALASYIQKQYGYYAYLPIIYDKISEIPMIPKRRDQDLDKVSVAFLANNSNPVTLEGFSVQDNSVRVMEDSGGCPMVLESSPNDEDLIVGAPNTADEYPKAYWKDRKKWLEEIKTDFESTGPRTCKLSLTQIWTCEDVSINLYARLRLTSPEGREIYSTPQSTSRPGLSINDGNPLSLQKPGMDHPLRITGEHRNDYIQFSYGPALWTSGTTTGDSKCALVGDDWKKSGPDCPGMAATRQFECEYPC